MAIAPVPKRPRFRGKVTFAPTPQGAAIAVPNARVRIWDLDVVGKDLLIDVTTDASGRFDAKATKDWQDVISVQTPFGRVTSPDTTDIPIFIVQIDDTAQNQSMSGPFGYVGDSIEVPLIVPWGPPAPPSGPSPGMITGVVSTFSQVMTINGVAVTALSQPDTVWEKIKDLVEAKQKVTITFGPGLGLPITLPFKGNQIDYDQFRVTVCGLLGIDPNSDVLRVNPEPSVLVAICIIVFIICVAMPMAVGNAVFVIILALAILLAVHMGYRVKVSKTDSASPGTTVSVPIPLSDIQIELIPPEN